MLKQSHFDRLSPFVRSAVYAHVWADTINECGEPAGMLVPGCRPEEGDDHLRLTMHAFRVLSRDAARFESDNAKALTTFQIDTGEDSEACGQWFALSRSGHGAGFFDASSPLARELDDAAGVYGSVYLELWRDGRIHLS